jgi:predicted GNAT family acetyltransferase
MDEPEVVDNRPAGRFEIRVDGELAGYAEYQRDGSTLSLTHTVVDDRFEGHGLGSALARRALDTARREGVRVLPYCPFIRGFIARHEEYLDLVPPDQRGRFDLHPDSGARPG